MNKYVHLAEHNGMGDKVWWIFRIVLINNLIKCLQSCCNSRLDHKRCSIIVVTELYWLKSFRTHLAALRCTFSYGGMGSK